PDRAREQPAPTLSGLVLSFEIHQDRQQEQEAGEDVAPLGGPRDRFGAQRMQREEERRRYGRQPKRARSEAGRSTEEAQGDEVERGGVRGEDHQARQVIPKRLHLPEDVIETKREPGER